MFLSANILILALTSVSSRVGTFSYVSQTWEDERQTPRSDVEVRDQVGEP
jgi:hypothetical protein